MLEGVEAPLISEVSPSPLQVSLSSSDPGCPFIHFLSSLLQFLHLECASCPFLLIPTLSTCETDLPEQLRQQGLLSPVVHKAQSRATRLIFLPFSSSANSHHH